MNDNNHYKNTEVDGSKFKIISRSQWSKYLKKSIKNSIDKNSELYHTLLKDFNTYGGKLVKTTNDREGAMFVGISSTDEDYYYVLILKNNKQFDINFHTCCGKLDIIEESQYTEKEYEFIDFFNKNKSDIINEINSLETDVMITPIKIGEKKEHYRLHKKDALIETFKHCSALFNEKPKCIEVLEDILLNLNSPNLNSIVIKLLNTYINEYSLYYKKLSDKHKKYYNETFKNKLNNILLKYTNGINNEKVVSYVTNVCKTMNKVFFNI